MLINGKEVPLAEYVRTLKDEIAELRTEMTAAMQDIPHKCWTCANGFYTDTGFECYECHYRGKNPDCLGWIWRGLRRKGN